MSDLYEKKRINELMALADDARKAAYAPYSLFAVGAAVLCDNNKIYTGCNIESVALTPGCCAERVAIYKAISDGNRSFQAIAIAGGPAEKPVVSCPPCGVCRQVMREFCVPENLNIYFLDAKGVIKCSTLADLLPESFGPDAKA